MTNIYDNYIATQQVGFHETYEFVYGLDTIEQYTSWHEDIPSGLEGAPYTAIPIKRSNINLDTQIGKTSVTVTSILIPAFAQFLTDMPILPVGMNIKRMSEDDHTSYEVIFAGRILSVTFSDGVASAQCEGSSLALNARFPKLVCKTTCNHRVFDQGCGLDIVTWAFDGTVSAISGNTITITGLDAVGNYFGGGYVIRNEDNNARMITRQSGDVIDINSSIPIFQNGDVVQVVPGCNGNKSTCENTFGNLMNFLGMVTIPTRNVTVYGAQ